MNVFVSFFETGEIQVELNTKTGKKLRSLKKIDEIIREVLNS